MVFFFFYNFLIIKIHEDNGDFVNCPCGSTDPRCLAIDIPSNDNQMSQDCITFVRAEAGQSDYGTNYEQTNFLSAFLDATQVYGSSFEISNELRSFSNGQMKISEGNYMPTSETDFSCSPDSTLACFIGGEPRPSENLALTGVHTLHMREHNRIANRLSSINPSWNDERLYQEARRILSAIMQHITYKEWLPIVIGQKNHLQPSTNGYSNSYNPQVNPAIANEFATSSFRFGHTLIRNNLDRYNLFNRIVGNVDLKTIIFDSTEAYK